MSAYTQSFSASSTGHEPSPGGGGDTLALHAGRPRDPGAPLVQGIIQSTTFRQSGVGDPVNHAYSRVSNPGVSELESALGELEGALPACAFATGLAAETALLLATLRTGDHVVLGDAIYGGTVRLLQQVLAPFGVGCTFVNASRPAEIAAAILPRTRLVFIESPANPTLSLTDIGVVARITRAAGVLLAVDNTFLTPVLQRPLDLGADVSVYSTTKHIEGHSAALGGALVTRDESLLSRLRFIRKSTGAIQSPFNAWLTVRGLRTLPLRLRRHSDNALRVARWLQRHPGVRRVNYPGLASFPQADLAARQHLGGLHGGVLSFELAGGVPAGLSFLRSVRLCSLVEHVGSIETLVTHPASMTHADVPIEQRLAVGITDGLVRLSVGLEDPEDVIADLDQAIERSIGADEPAAEQRLAATAGSAVIAAANGGAL